MNKIYFLFAALTLSLTGLSQGIVNGRVTSTDGNPIEYVSVGILATAHPTGTTTNAEGAYQLTITTSDSVFVRFSATGYNPQQHRIAVPDGGILRLDVELMPHATQLQEVQVNDDRSRTTSFTQIDAAKLDNVVGPSSGVESLLKTLPDVGSNNEISSQYSVRGGSFDENLVYINGVEIFRPMLVRSGQQEGLSIINPDMVHHIQFSPGGFDASYGDRMASALDITYRPPTRFHASASGSFLGGSAHVGGTVGNRLSYSIGYRYHSNKYLFSSLDTKGAYTTAYSDIQSVIRYQLTNTLDIELLALWSRNKYGLIPESQTTSFGTFTESMELDVYFDGQEVDQYNTQLGAITMSYHPTSKFQLQWITAAQTNSEQEHYDIQSQYWIYEIGFRGDAEVEKFDRGVGTYLEHARNNLQTTILSSELRGWHQAKAGSWQWGAKVQMDLIDDKVSEWKWVDSAGYTVPATFPTPGDPYNMPTVPILQNRCKAHNGLRTLRIPIYLQRDVSFTTPKETDLKFQAGIRGQYYSTTFDSTSYLYANASTHGQQFILSPRINMSIKPKWERDMLFRTAVGVYQQPPIYRELRRSDGSLTTHIDAQQSYQVTETFDWNMRIKDRPFRFTADLYYKYLTHLVPYTIDNLRLRYNPDAEATGYAAGLSLRLGGEFVDGLESWASVSIMQTQEDIEGDGIGWIARPTDQRFSFKLFFQDYVPTLPWWRMSINIVYGTGMPVTFPYQKDRSSEHRLPAYFRVDWGNTIALSQIEPCRHWNIFRYVDDIQLSVEVFNLFNYHNVVSYIWVADYSNTYYPVPNYLTARQLNLKLTVKI